MGIYGIIILDNNYKNMELNKWAFWWILLVYFIISLILFNSTSTGLRALGWFLIPGFIYVIILLILLLVTINIITKTVKISWVSLMFLLIIQSIALIANLIYDRMLGASGLEYCQGSEVCSQEDLLAISVWIYILVLIVFITYTYYRSFKKVSK
jgi:hypothetical protein